MEKDVTQSADLYHLVAWFDANRKRVITILAVVLIVSASIGAYIWHKNYVETQAGEAISNMKQPATAEEAAAINLTAAQSYLKIADDYPGTRGGERALLIAGGILFDNGKFDQSKAAFDKFMTLYPESSLANQAQLGIAASLEAAGKNDEAAKRYDDLIKHHATDSTIPQAKSALARLYVSLNKPEQAMRLYEELAKGNNNDTWSAEAGIQLQELLAKHPELKKPVATAPSAVTIPSATPIVKVPPAK